MSQINVRSTNNTKKEIRKFVKFAWKIYKNNPYWVPPLISSQMDFILRGTYHDSGVIQPFMAYQNGEPVGRIIAHYDKRYNKMFQKQRGCFGFFECINDKNVSNALFDSCLEWLVTQGMNEMYGPLNFTIYDSSGLLMNDYNSEPVLELPYNPPYYINLLSDYGFEKVIDWYAYRFTRDQNLPAIVYKARERLLKAKGEISFRHVNLRKYWEESRKMLEVFNKAWEENWDHMPLTENQFNFFAKEMKPVAKSELIIFAEHEGRLVGYILSTPDVNQAIKCANGRLFPFGLFKMLWAFRKINRIKLFMLGVLPEFRGRMIESYLIVETYEQAKKMGYREADISLIVETNTNLIRILDKSGAERYKTFRHYSKSISQQIDSINS